MLVNPTRCHMTYDWHVGGIDRLKPKAPEQRELRTDAFFFMPSNDSDHEYMGRPNLTVVHVWNGIKRLSFFFFRKKENYALPEYV